MAKLKYTGARVGDDKFTFLLFGKRWYEDQELNEEEIKKFSDVDMPDWRIVKTSKSKKVEEIEEEEEEEKETSTCEESSNNDDEEEETEEGTIYIK